MTSKLAMATIATLVWSFAMTLSEASVIPMPILTMSKSGHSAFPRDESFHNNDLNTDTKMAAKHFFEKRNSGAIISSCTVPNTVAVTFDDGPFKFTSDLLDFLDREKVKVTFFMNGRNLGDIWKYDWVVKKAYNAGHQIASHTWSHIDLATATESETHEEMSRLDQAIKSIIGVRPLFMRPPFGYLNWASENYLRKNGYTIVDWTIDTNDWRHPEDINASLSAYKDALSRPGAHGHGFIALEHDALGTTAARLAPAVIKYAKDLGFEVVPVGACLGLEPSQWYRQ